MRRAVHDDGMRVPCPLLSTVGCSLVLRAGCGMVGVADPNIAKVLKLTDRGMELRAAWEKCGSPTTWGNMRRWHTYGTGRASPSQ